MGDRQARQTRTQRHAVERYENGVGLRRHQPHGAGAEHYVAVPRREHRGADLAEEERAGELCEVQACAAAQGLCPVYADGRFRDGSIRRQRYADAGRAEPLLERRAAGHPGYRQEHAGEGV